MITEKDKTFYHCYDNNITVGNPVKIPGGSVIPIVSVTSIYGGMTKLSCSGGGCLVLVPLALFVVQEDKLEICLIKQKSAIDSLSNFISLAAELLS